MLCHGFATTTTIVRAIHGWLASLQRSISGWDGPVLHVDEEPVVAIVL